MLIPKRNHTMAQEQIVMTDPEMMKLLQTIAKTLQNNSRSITQNDKILQQIYSLWCASLCLFFVVKCI